MSSLTSPACVAAPDTYGQDFPFEEHWLENADGISLRYWYFPSQNRAAVLSMGGLSGSLGTNLPVADFLVAEGYGLLEVDSRACASPHKRVTLGHAEIFDAATGLEFLLSRPEVDADRIGALGFSMGGVTVIRGAARHPEINAIVAEGGYFNLGEDIVEPGSPRSIPLRILLYSIAGVYWYQAGANPWKISPIDDIALISPRPVFLIYGENEVDDGRGYLQFEAAGEPKSIWIVPGGNHGANHLVAPMEYKNHVLEFFNRHLLKSEQLLSPD